jgi:hypothetical protein
MGEFTTLQRETTPLFSEREGKGSRDVKRGQVDNFLNYAIMVMAPPLEVSP